MVIIGLTGGIASGKSTAAEYLSTKNAEIVDADKISHQITAKGKKGWKLIKNEFGEGILKEDGEIDRRELGNIIFNSREKKELLESILHPLIIEEMKKKAQKIMSEGKNVIFMAPLLFETGLDRFCDQIWVINAGREKQIKRIKNRDGLSTEEAEKRIDSQLPIQKKIAGADVVIDNNGTLKELKDRLDYYWEKCILGGSPKW
ncbi:MAG: dephospho-CoA kinase [Bacillota bacterium]